MDFIKVNVCDELLEGDRRLLQSRLIDYVIYIKDIKKLSTSAMLGSIAAIRKFYEMKDVELK
jgi:hypothetical protein